MHIFYTYWLFEFWEFPPLSEPPVVSCGVGAGVGLLLFGFSWFWEELLLLSDLLLSDFLSLFLELDLLFLLLPL